jgi:hypothetical protein
MGVALAALALGSPWLCTVHAGSRQRGKDIEFSGRGSDSVKTNLSLLNPKNDNLKQLEEELSRSARSFSTESSLDAVAPPLPEHQPITVIPSKRQKQQLDRQKNFFFLAPDDFMKTPTLEEMLNLPEYGSDGRLKDSKSTLELYYEREDGKHGTAGKSTRSGRDEKSSGDRGSSRDRDRSKSGDDRGLPTGLEEREQALRKLMESDITENPFTAAAAKRGSFENIFGQDASGPSKQQILEHKKYMEQFSSILEPSRPAAVSPDIFKSPSDGLDSSRRLANPFAVPESSPTGREVLDLVNPLLTPTSPQNLNFQSPGQSGLIPKVEAPRAPAVPTFSAPRRPSF